jgi:hypothetical protein
MIFEFLYSTPNLGAVKLKLSYIFGSRFGDQTLFKLGFIRSLGKCFEYYIKLVSLCEHHFNYFVCLKGLFSIYRFGISFFMFRFQDTLKKYKAL